ncbi:PucR family transcriptional regulator ligand-binding domain-containing protein [Saccharopolyspora montiporae]|uniref:PucR family transcriptional regulator ligand-binding domain-containing protein n=1 Tax=Saccharopolyspora montiporae TaxID=2781240 RepID=UPI00351C3424
MVDLDNEVSVPLRAVVDDVDLAVRVVPESLPDGALQRPVRWAHVSELREPGPYLVGGELLLTAGVNLPRSAAEVNGYVAGLLACGVSALAFGRTPDLHEQLPERLRAACVRHGLPLLVVDPRTPFLAVNRAVSRALARAADREQQRIAEAREALTRAAADGPQAVLRELAARLSGWCALIGPDDRPLAGCRAPDPLPAELAGLFARLRAGTGTRTATAELDGSYVVAQPVYPQATSEHLLLAGRSARFRGSDRAIMSVGAALLGLVAHALTGAARLGAAVTAALTGADPAAVAAAALPAERYRLVAGMWRGDERIGVETEQSWLCSRLGTPLVRLDRARFTAVVRQLPDEAVLHELAARGWLAAVGGPVPAADLPGAVPEVRLLLDRAGTLRHPVAAGDEGSLTEVVPPDAAAGFAHRLLAPLLQRRDDVLVPTLRTWLSCHGGWDRTAAELGVHRNSVRHRISQAEKALGVDLADPDVRMNLWFALRWLAD